MDLDLLDELFGIRMEARESTTVAGLVSEVLGRIPEKGEVVESDGLKFEILESTDRRVQRLRVTSKQPSTQPQQINSL
jgi:putative hemolysin